MSLIIGTLIDRNGVMQDGTKQVSVNCSEITTPPVQAWIVPNPTFTGYNFPTYTAPSPGTAFDIEVVEVKVGTDTYRFSGLLSQFITLCNQCCDAESFILTPIAYTPLVLQQPPIWTDNGDCTCTSTYNYRLPADGGGKAYTLKFYCNGVLIGTSTSFTTVAAALAYAIANWGAYGTWTLSGSVLILTNGDTPACNNSSIVVTYTTRDYCISLAGLSGLTFNQLYTNNVIIATGTKTISTPAAFVTAMQPFISDGTLTAHTNSVQYHGTGLPQSIRLNTALIASFNVGGCAT